jgi:superfamily II DNA helicase RecQ
MNQQRVVEYASRRGCRWSALLEYFGDEESTDTCGRCDNCDGRAA